MQLTAAHDVLKLVLVEVDLQIRPRVVVDLVHAEPRGDREREHACMAKSFV